MKRPVYHFCSTIQERGIFLPSLAVDTEVVKNEPMLFNCDFPSAYRLGGPLTRQFLRQLPDDWLDCPIVVDSRVHMLMPGWWPCIPGWHHDDIARGADGQPDYDDLPYRSEHLMGLVNGHLAPTRFGLGEVTLPAVDGVVYAGWDPLVAAAVAEERLRPYSAPSGVYIQFDWQSFHEGVQAVESGWRWFIRLSRNTIRTSTCTNEVRRQVQVYMADPRSGW